MPTEHTDHSWASVCVLRCLSQVIVIILVIVLSLSVVIRSLVFLNTEPSTSQHDLLVPGLQSFYFPPTTQVVMTVPPNARIR